MSNLLIKAGKLVVRAGRLVLAAAECITQCCNPSGNWYCYVLPDSGGYYVSMCGQAPLPEGATIISGPHPDSEGCMSICSTVQYGWYCCWDGSIVDGYHTLSCVFGEGCPDGSVGSGPMLNESDCTYVCNEETTGACCPFSPNGGCAHGSCQPTDRYWQKNDCGTCTEIVPGSEGPDLISDGCYVWAYSGPDYASAGPCFTNDTGSAIGYATEEGCKYKWRAPAPCVDYTHVWECPNGFMQPRWYPGQMCYETACPSDCYGTGEPSKCDGETRPPTGYNPGLGCTQCEKPPAEAVITLNGGAPGCSGVAWTGNAEQDAAIEALVNALLVDVLDRTYTAPLYAVSPGCGFSTNAIAFWKFDTQDVTGGKVFVRVWVLLRFFQSGGYLAAGMSCDDTHYDVAYSLGVDWQIGATFIPDGFDCSAVLDGPRQGVGGTGPTCGFFVGSWGCTADAATVRQKLPNTRNRYCDCEGFKDCDNSSIPFEFPEQSPPCGPECIDVLSGTTATVAVST